MMNDRIIKLPINTRGKTIDFFPCSAYALRSIRIPGELSAKDFKAYVARRLPTLFPSRAEPRRFDLQRGSGGSCTVFACDIDFPSELAGESHNLRRSAAIWRLRGSDLIDGIRIFAVGDYAEVAHLKDGVAVSIQAVDTPCNPATLEALVPREAIVELVCDGVAATTWLSAFAGSGDRDIRRFPVAALSPGAGQRGIFSDEKDMTLISKAAPYIRVVALGLVLLLSIGFVRSRYELALDRLKNYRSGLASTVIDAGELARRRDMLRMELLSYGSRAPSAVAVLEKLASICSSSLVVDRFSISDGRFEIWAISGDALAELESIEADTRFSGVTLKGIVPGSGGQERFSLIGDYHD